MTPADLGELAGRLVPVAARLAAMVREEDREAIGTYLASLGEAERWALPVVLAAMVPADQTPAQLLEWVTWDEHGKPLPLDVAMVMCPALRPVRACGEPAPNAEATNERRTAA